MSKHIFDHLPPVRAAVQAWTDPGPRPDIHRRAQDQVRQAMPVLARALDRLAAMENRRPPQR